MALAQRRGERERWREISGGERERSVGEREREREGSRIPPSQSGWPWQDEGEKEGLRVCDLLYVCVCVRGRERECVCVRLRLMNESVTVK
jgi:hypothetical protein